MHVGFGAVQYVFYLPGQAVGLVEAADFWITKTGAQQTGKLPVAVESFIIHFDDEDMIEARENILQAIGQRVDMANMQRGNTVSGGAGSIDGFANRSLRRA